MLSEEPSGGASLPIQASPYSFLLKKKTYSYLFCTSSFFEILFPLLLLGQASVRSVPEAASFLESKSSEGGHCLPLLCFLSFTPSLSLFLFFIYFILLFLLCVLPPSFLSMAKPLVSFPSFSQFAKALHHFFNVLCVLS